MILLDNKLISDDILKNKFACALDKCKGGCCVKGDAGAPIETEEITLIDKNIEHIKPFMDELGLQVLKEKGFYVSQGDKHETTCAASGECVFVSYKNDIATCAIENAYTEGKSTFLKPISCHLYPVRVSKVGAYTTLNYHHWDICNPACENGEKLGLPVYTFLKSAIIRAFGKDFYNMLSAYANYQKDKKAP